MGSVESGPIVDKLQASGIAATTYPENPTPTNRDELLNTMINEVSVVIQPLGAKSENSQFARVMVSSFFPSNISLAVFSHAGLFVYGNGRNPNDGVFVEYGAYDYKREGDYNSQVHYFRKDNGLRFTLLNIDDIEGYKFKCDVQNKMTINDLCTCLEYHHFSKQKYNLVDQNCQYFVRKSIQILGSRRLLKSDRIRTYNKGIIPHQILEVFEKNEDDENIEERIPIIGYFVGLIKMASND